MSETQSTVTIYHGYESDGRMVFGFDGEKATPDIAVLAYSYKTDRAGTDLDVIYRRNNAVDGTEYNVFHKARSLSIGDIVGIAHPEAGAVVDFHLVSSVGFTLIASDSDLPSAIKLVTKEQVRAIREALV